MTFPKTNPGIQVEPVSTDPLNPDFTSFGIIDTDSGDDLCVLRADDIVQQRNFMAALGGRGPGLYSQSSDEPETSNEDTDGSDARSELLRRQTSYNSRTNKGGVSCPTYANAVERLPREFYFPNAELPEPAKQSRPADHEPMPLYDSSDPTPLVHRTESAAFLPPHGPAVFSPVVVGYGVEVGLRPHQMAVWDPKRHFYYFIDHKLKTCFIEDPRPQKKWAKPALKRQEIAHKGNGGSRRLSGDGGGGEFTNACRDPLIVRVTAERAARKPHGFTLRACGRDGELGADGKEGSSGENGLQGYEYPTRGTIDGNPGGDGTYGEPGKDGACGTDGTKGHDIVMELSGSAAELCVSGSCDFTAKLGGEEREEVVFVDCRGGSGGDGGQGGCGGRGGHGGEGGTGAMGGDGGYGGDGGMGGDGGKGGIGGNTGSGGRCVVQTTDPRLLILVEADCTTGSPGKGGSRVKGGKGGAAGFGGRAGPGNEGSTTSAHPGGLTGKPGMSGCDGRDGEPGAGGLHGNDGGILWVVKSDAGEVLHQAGARYDAEVLSLEVSTSGGDNGLYVPNQQVCVSGVTVVNSGGIPLPRGAKLSIPSTTTVRFEHTVFELPELAPNEKFQVPVEFRGRIFDQPAPNQPGEFAASACFAPRIELLGRPFEKSVSEQRFPVNYPVKIPFILSKSSIGRGEVAAFEIGIQNVSLLPYGSSVGSGAGSVDVRIRMDRRFIPLGLIAANSPDSEDGETTVPLPYAVTYSPATPDSIHVKVTEIRPGETLVVPIAVQLASQSELCDTCLWQADLYFRGKLIEYKQSEIRVSPAYSPPQSASKLSDVLMITNSSISKHEFAYWQQIFDLLGVSVDYWDASYHKQEESQESEHQASPLPPFKHMYAGKLILYPYCNLEGLPADEIISHFHGENWRDGGELTPSDSSMVLFCSPLHQKSLEQHFMHDYGNANLLKHLCRNEEPIRLPADAFSGHHLFAPGTIVSSDWSIKKREKSVAKKLEREVPSRAVALMSHSIFVQPKGKLKYKYGSMDLRRCPLLRSCNFQCIDGAGGNMTAMGLDDPLSSPSMSAVPLASNFGQVFLATLCGLPLRCKLAALRTQAKKSSAPGCHLHFDLPNGVSLSTAEVVAIATASDIADELLSCSGETSKMKLLAEDVQEHRAVYAAARSSLVLRLLELIKREATERRRLIGSNAQVTQAVKGIHRHCNDVAALLASSADDDHNCTRHFPAMKLLQDSNRVIRCHQHTVEEDHYALTKS